MIKVLRSEETREVDRQTTEKYGISSIILMENAAHFTVRSIEKKLGSSVKGKSFLILCGKGNNGGDGAALARILWLLGASAHVFIFGKIDETKGDARTNFEVLRSISKSASSDGRITFTENFEDKEFSDEIITRIEHSNNFDVLIDALFGTGLTRSLDDSLTSLLEKILIFFSHKGRVPLRVSVDIPSGLNANSPKPIGKSFQADLTVTFTAPKLANIFPPASNFNGELHVVDIGSPRELVDASSSQTFLGEKKDAKNWLMKTKFSPDSYKNKRGVALLISGSKKYSGAAVLSGNGAMASGVGMVTVATSDSALSAVSGRVLSEVIVVGVAETERGAISSKAFEPIQKLSNQSDAVLIGSGMCSDENTTRRFVKKVVENRKKPIVVDADGLNALSPFDIEGSEKFPLVLTPHEGEFLRLLDIKDKQGLEDRIQAARNFTRKHKTIIVLKGERTLIADPSGKVVINPTGNSGLGKAGNGDNLAGIITGFIAQSVCSKVDIFETVVAAVYIAGLAGDIAEIRFGKRAMLASDVRECLFEAFRETEKRNE